MEQGPGHPTVADASQAAPHQPERGLKQFSELTSLSLPHVVCPGPPAFVSTGREGGVRRSTACGWWRGARPPEAPLQVCTLFPGHGPVATQPALQSTKGREGSGAHPLPETPHDPSTPRGVEPALPEHAAVSSSLRGGLLGAGPQLCLRWPGVHPRLFLATQAKERSVVQPSVATKRLMYTQPGGSDPRGSIR